MKAIEEKADLYGRMKVALYIKANGDWPKDELPMPGRLDLQQKRYDAYDLMQAFEDGASEALQSQWRSVEQELPDESEEVVAAYKDRITQSIKYAVAWTDRKGQWHSNDDDINVYGVVAWFPIPEF